MNNKLRLTLALLGSAAVSLVHPSAAAGASQDINIGTFIAQGFSLNDCHATAAKLPDHKLYGQLLLVGFSGTKKGQKGVELAYRNIRDGKVGGVILFGKNVVSPKQVRDLNNYLKRANPQNPPFIAVDEEGGLVQRLPKKKGFGHEPSALTMRKLGLQKARAYYNSMAKQLRRDGFNLNFGPVVDLHKPGNPVIAKYGRSYSASPQEVAQFASEFIEAHHKHGVLTALKHFPGHGFSRHDTHKQFVDVTNDWKPDEARPYEILIRKHKNIDMVMTGHLIHRTGWSKNDGLPASLSRAAIRTLLRGGFNRFGGVIITDDLQMRAITNARSIGSAVVLALKAGNDIALVGNQLTKKIATADHAISKISQAVKEGVLERDQLVYSYCRIRKLKNKIR